MFKSYCAFSNPESFPLDISPFVSVSSSEISLLQTVPENKIILEYRRRLFLTRLGADGIILVEVDAGNYLHTDCLVASSHLPSL